MGHGMGQGGKTAWWRDVSVSAVVAGFVAVLVGYTSSVAIVFQAAQALGATTAQTVSWMWALGLAMGISCIGLSLHYRLPVLTAWSTPGAERPGEGCARWLAGSERARRPPCWPPAPSWSARC